ncbi:hypothetical protein, partial [Burkholderia gladioli]
LFGEPALLHDFLSPLEAILSSFNWSENHRAGHSAKTLIRFGRSALSHAADEASWISSSERLIQLPPRREGCFARYAAETLERSPTSSSGPAKAADVAYAPSTSQSKA